MGKEIRPIEITEAATIFGIDIPLPVNHRHDLGQMSGLPASDAALVAAHGEFVHLLPADAELPRVAALLGKPYNLLDGEQRPLLQKHPQIGHNILIGIERFRDSAHLIKHHHECFDGSGYPERLSGIAIPQGSRILAVANDYDALQVGTLVQRPLKPTEALSYIVENRGKRYDPTVVDAFVQLISETRSKGFIELPLRSMHLKPGMLLSRDLNHRDGYLLLAAGSCQKAEFPSMAMVASAISRPALAR